MIDGRLCQHENDGGAHTAGDALLVQSFNRPGEHQGEQQCKGHGNKGRVRDLKQRA